MLQRLQKKLNAPGESFDLSAKHSDQNSKLCLTRSPNETPSPGHIVMQNNSDDNPF